jgi:hypothetical protein
MVQDDKTLFPIPVRFKDLDISGAFVNSAPIPDTESKFNNRFTLIDTTVGTEDGIVKYVRLPTTIQFWFKPNPDSAGKIYTPVMDIQYVTKSASQLSDPLTSRVQVEDG